MLVILILLLSYLSTALPMEHETSHQEQIIKKIDQDLQQIDAMHDAVKEVTTLFTDIAHKFPMYTLTLLSLKKHEADLYTAFLNAEIAKICFEEETYLNHRVTQQFQILDNITIGTITHAWSALEQIKNQANLLISNEKPGSPTWANLINYTTDLTRKQTIIDIAAKNYVVAKFQLENNK